MRTLKRPCFQAGLVVIAACGAPALGQLVPYRGFDRVQTPSVATAVNSLAAEAAWLAGVSGAGPVHTADFESATVGTSGTSMVIAPGVTMNVWSGHNPEELRVDSGPTPHLGSLRGFNSTAGGSNHLYYGSGDIVSRPRINISFAQPIQAFSLFITGEGANRSGFIGDLGFTRIYLNGSINHAMGFGDGGNPYWPSTVQPDVRFGGFIDPTASITHVSIVPRFGSSMELYHPSISVDDLRWIPAVPSPGGLALVAMGSAAAMRRGRRRDQRGRAIL